MVRASDRRDLPSVESLLSQPLLAEGLPGIPRRLVVEAARERLAVWRAAVASGEREIPALDVLAAETRAHALFHRPGPRRVVNATGVLLHTNLGRAPLSEAAADAAREAALHYSTLEFDLARGVRGSRQAHAAQLLRLLTGAERALVVNNNAAGVLLALRALARGREVIVSRGQLVEIGGAFRLPDVMAVSGARLVEVGTTNRTHPDDYRRALTADTAAILFVHRSNFRMTGFVADVPLETLAAIGRDAGVPLLADLGSGALFDLRTMGGSSARLPGETTLGDALRAGATLALASGDKLLGGPQAGIVVGAHAAVDTLARDPLMRALRPDKMTLAALVATLTAYLEPERAAREIPTLAALAADRDTLAARARGIARALASRLGGTAEVGEAEDVSEVGGGAMPETPLATVVVTLRARSLSAEALEEALRHTSVPVIVRIKEDRVLLDPRTIHPGEEGLLVDAVLEALGERRPDSPASGPTR